jgi:RNA polymerase sigma factor (sigma-70 family)
MHDGGRRTPNERDPTRALSLAALGQFEDFRSLYEALAPSLYAWARLRTGAMALDPDDLLQEVWIRALQSGAQFDPAKGSFRAWIFGIAKHAYLEALRQKPVRRDPTHLGGGAAALDAWPDVATSIRSRLARDESVQKLLADVATIDETDRRILVHCGLEDMPCTLAAVRLGLNAELVTKRWQRLRARLRERGVDQLLGP